MNFHEALKQEVEECRAYKGEGHLVIQVVIPVYAGLTADEQRGVDAGEPWPIRVETLEVPAKQCRLLEFLMERTIAEGGFRIANDNIEVER